MSGCCGTAFAYGRVHNAQSEEAYGYSDTEIGNAEYGVFARRKMFQNENNVTLHRFTVHVLREVCCQRQRIMFSTMRHQQAVAQCG